MWRPRPIGAVTVESSLRAEPQDLSDSPLYLLAVLYSARRSKDRALERVTRRQLDALGVQVRFGDELPTRRPNTPKGVSRE